MAKTNGVKTVEVESNQVLTEKQQRGVVKILKVLLADELVLYTRLRNYHWNVTGVNFYALHAAFEGQFNTIADVADEVAERIRQYGAHAPGTMDEFIQKARLSEAPGVYPDPRTMVANLVADHEAIMGFLREDAEKIDEESGDIGAVDLLTRLLQQHQKMAWMLRMCLEGQTAPSEE
jgi:starvation-inducible DNA-binding protein